MTPGRVTLTSRICTLKLSKINIFNVKGQKDTKGSKRTQKDPKGPKRTQKDSKGLKITKNYQKRTKNRPKRTKKGLKKD